MPIYEYKCRGCEKSLEILRKMSDPPLEICPSCGGELIKAISSTSFVLKGSGWYKDGYSSTSGNSSSDKSASGKSSGSDVSGSGGDAKGTSSEPQDGSSAPKKDEPKKDEPKKDKTDNKESGESKKEVIAA